MDGQLDKARIPLDDRMVKLIDRKGDYIGAALTTCEWARNLLEPDGNFAGSEGSIAAFYKAPRAFATAGFVREAEAVTTYVRRHFFANGDFNRGREGTSLDGANYFNAWLCWGTHTIGAYDLAYPGGDHLERVQHPDLGGIPECPKPSLTEQEIEWGATASAIVAFTAMGRLAQATRVGEFLLDRLLRGQPQPGASLYLRMDWEGSWKTRFTPDDAHHRVWQARSALLVLRDWDGRPGASIPGDRRRSIPQGRPDPVPVGTEVPSLGI